MDENDVVAALSALAHPVRLRLFRALVVAGTEGLTPGVMQQGLGIPATTLSFHLKELTAAALIGSERVGRHLIYRTDYARMGQVLSYLTDNCCAGHGCGVSTDDAKASACVEGT